MLHFTKGVWFSEYFQATYLINFRFNDINVTRTCRTGKPFDILDSSNKTFCSFYLPISSYGTRLPQESSGVPIPLEIYTLSIVHQYKSTQITYERTIYLRLSFTRG